MTDEKLKTKGHLVAFWGLLGGETIIYNKYGKIKVSS